MFGFKLKMREGRFEESRSIGVREPLQVTHADYAAATLPVRWTLRSRPGTKFADSPSCM